MCFELRSALHEAFMLLETMYEFFLITRTNNLLFLELQLFRRSFFLEFISCNFFRTLIAFLTRALLKAFDQFFLLGMYVILTTENKLHAVYNQTVPEAHKKSS